VLRPGELEKCPAGSALLSALSPTGVLNDTHKLISGQEIFSKWRFLPLLRAGVHHMWRLDVGAGDRIACFCSFSLRMREGHWPAGLNRSALYSAPGQV